MTEPTPRDNRSIRNVGIVAHVDAGKTTTTEQFLYLCGRIRRPGSVDAGSTQTDTLPEERARGITIRAAATALPWRGHTIHLIDTPGHVDFAPEVQRALAVLDGAILIVSAADGVQPHTERLWRHLADLALPTLIAINKMDQAEADPDGTLAQIRQHLTPLALPLQRPLGVARDFAGAMDLGGFRRRGDPEAAPPAAEREAFSIAVAEADDTLAERYLSGAVIGEADLRAAIARATAGRTRFPVLFTSAARGIGIESLLDAVVDFLPPPRGRADEPFAARVFKVDRDPILGKAAHACITAGRLRTRDLVRVPGRPASAGTEEKVTLMRALQGAPREHVTVAEAGEIIAVFGLASVRSGDLLGASAPTAAASFAEPVLTVRARLTGPGDPHALQSALGILEDEDPDLRLEWSARDREALLSVMGPVHVEYLQSILLNRFSLEVTFDRPTPALLETVGAPCTGESTYTGPLGDHDHFARAAVRLDPLPRGAGSTWTDHTRDLPPPCAAAAQAGAMEALGTAGPLRGRPLVDVGVTLTAFGINSVVSNAADFGFAAADAVRAAVAACPRPVLLEPVLAYDLSAAVEHAPRILAHLTALGATVAMTDAASTRLRVKGEIPAAVAWDVPAEIAQLSKGRGSWDVRPLRYREVTA